MVTTLRLMRDKAMLHCDALPSYAGPANWRGSNIRNPEDWHTHLTESHIADITSPLQRRIADAIRIQYLNPE